VQVGSGLHCQLVETTGNSALSGGLHCTGGETMKTWGGGHRTPCGQESFQGSSCRVPTKEAGCSSSKERVHPGLTLVTCKIT
jgi:hypothetical protein